MNIKKIAKNWLPPILHIQLHALLKRGIYFQGEYSDWAEASAKSSGYESGEILENVKRAMLKVKKGAAKFERDSVCFHEEEFRWSTLSCLLAVAAKSGGQLNVMDFGGSLGSFYFQHKKIFSGLKRVRWAVVEQKHYVEVGRAEAADDVLEFYDTISECLEHGNVDVVLCSSVLQYLEDPYEILTLIAQANIKFLILDRTPFTESECDRITMQSVPKNIYKATLPLWLFSERKFNSIMKQLGYTKELEFLCDEGVNLGITFKGIKYQKDE